MEQLQQVHQFFVILIKMFLVGMDILKKEFGGRFKMTTNKPIVQPTHFELVLKHNDKEVFKKVLDWLFEVGFCDFQWEYSFDGQKEEFELSIQTDWAHNLKTISELLGDYNNEET